MVLSEKGVSYPDADVCKRFLAKGAKVYFTGLLDKSTLKPCGDIIFSVKHQNGKVVSKGVIDNKGYLKAA
jgi:predicted ribosome-associated RNA-binding protein Tma20